MTTNVSSAWRRTGSGSRSAFSNASSTRCRIVTASSMLLRPGARTLPLVVAEVGVAGAGRHDQVVVGGVRAVGEHHPAIGRIDGFHLAEEHLGVGLVSRSTERMGAAMSLGFNAAVATWYSMGWKR